MANLEFCDKHNMVAYLKKPTGSEGFQEIVDFLNGSHIRFALTKNPTIYLMAKNSLFTKALSANDEIQVSTVGLPYYKYIVPTLTPKLFSNMKRGFSGEHTPLFPSILAIQAEEGEDEAVYEEWYDRVERATTTAAILDVAQASGGSPRCQEATGGSIAQTRSKRVPTQPYDLPLLRVNTLGSNEGNIQLQELMALCTKLSYMVLALETDLRHTKKVYGAAYTKLIMKVKKLEKTIKSNQARRRAKIVVSDDEEDLEDSSKHGRMIEEIDQNAGVTLITPIHSQEDKPEDQLGVFSAAKVLADASKNVHTYSRRRRAVSTGNGRVSTASRLFSTAEESVSTAGALMPVSTAGMVQEVSKDKGKGIMTESEPEQTKTKLQQRQERIGYEAAVRLQEQLNEEERQRIAKMHEESSSFNIEEWENIQATIEADEELAQRVQAEEREKYSEAEKARLLAELINQRKRYFA
ncbi:hypothetical protein Tco_1030268 [Tanacetum coccineum]|uniref:Uncharacterized protein n=1 Tax=Tanacetum coccineum TaxID=301880 RepID=A0ABQ5G5R2_9ASTR